MRPALLKPLASAAPAQLPPPPGGEDLKCYAVFFTKDPFHKKHKVYEDGVLTLDGKQAQLFDLDGKQVSKSLMKLGGMDPGQTLELGRVSLEVTHPIAAAEYTSGRCFTAGAAGGGGGGRGDVAAAALASVALLRPVLKPLASTAGGVSAPFKPPTSSFGGGGLKPLGGGLKPLGSIGGGGGAALSRPEGLVPTKGLPPLGNTSGTPAAAAASTTSATGDAGASASSSSSSAAAAAPGPPPGPRVSLGVGGSSFGGISKFGAGGGGSSGGNSGAGGPRHDPHAPNALVLSWPPGWPGAPAPASAAQPPPPPGAPPQVPVVVDPVLTRFLRPHQREGVQFLYDCVTGRRGCGGGGAGGAILADDMGLGKTLQTVALVWTLLKQSPAGASVPTISKAVVVCPSSLVQNWRAEFKKWLGDARCDPLAVSVQGAEARAKVNEFAVGKASVLIVSYEMLRKHADVITTALGGGKVGLLVCDEGHRLKSSGGNKTIAALESLHARRRVLLTGTPLQNDLSELYALASFACPGALGTLPQFKAAFQGPIEKGRDKAASPAQARIAADRAAALGDKLAGYVLRRTSSVLDAYLPPKAEATLFVALAPLQCELYRAIVQSKAARSAALKGAGGGSSSGGGGGNDAGVLVVLNALRQCCIHPDFLHPDAATALPPPPTGAAGAGGGGGHKGKRPAPLLGSGAGGVSIGVAKRAALSGGSSSAASAGGGLTKSGSVPSLSGSDDYGGGNDDDTDATSTSGSASIGAIKRKAAATTKGAAASFGAASTRDAARGGGGGGKRVKRASDNDDGESDDSEGSLADFIEHDKGEGDEDGGGDGYEDGGGDGDEDALLADEKAMEDDGDGASAASAAVPYEARLAALPASAALREDLKRVYPAGYVPGLLARASAAAAAAGGRGGGSVDVSAALAVSGKLRLLDALLREIRGCASPHIGGGVSAASSGASPVVTSPDRVVVISNYAQVLHLVAGLCDARGYAYLRLDGSTPAGKRQELVNAFNAPPGGPAAPGAPFAFLLSAQAGGVGLNLIGANRLVLLDLAWNPAIDKQALARVWRDGQPKATYIYRLLGAGSLDEKVLQRQELKASMATALNASSSGGGGSSSSAPAGGGARFSQDELRALFALDPSRVGGGTCDTADVMNRAHSQATLAAAASSSATASSSGASLTVVPPPPRHLHWAPFTGPASLADAALRRAVEAVGGTAGGDASGASSSSSSSTAAARGGGVVYVRTVLFNQPGAAGWRGDGDGNVGGSSGDGGGGAEGSSSSSSASAAAPAPGAAVAASTAAWLAQLEGDLQLSDSSAEGDE